jgi:hypothetical protein
MIDVQRVRGSAAALGSLAVAMVAVCSMLALSIGLAPLSLLGNDWPTYTLVSHERTGKRLSGVLRDGLPPGSRFGVMLGASTLECGVNPALLGPDGEMPLRWLSLSGKGTTDVDLEGMAELVFREGLRPEILVLALHPSMAACSDDYLGDSDSQPEGVDTSALAQHVAARQWRELLSDLALLPRFVMRSAFPERRRLAFRLQYLTLRARTDLFQAIGLGAAVIFPPERDPWVVDPEWANGPHLSQPGVAAAMEGFRQRGWFDAAQYSPNSRQTQAIVRLSERCKSLKISELIVLMPESSAFHALVPSQAEESLSVGLRSAMGKHAPPIIDLRHSIPEERFRDPVHVDRAGREILSRQFRSILLEQLDQPRLAQAIRTP